MSSKKKRKTNVLIQGTSVVLILDWYSKGCKLKSNGCLFVEIHMCLTLTSAFNKHLRKLFIATHPPSIIGYMGLCVI